MIDSSIEVNAMTSVYAAKLGFKLHHTNVEAQKINDSILKIFGILLASFQMKDKLKKNQYFQKTSLLADFNVEVILGILFLTFSNANILFAEKKLI